MIQRFEEVSVKAVRRWVDANGKRHQETRKFWQTISPFNTEKDPPFLPKTREQIIRELDAERQAWLAECHQEGK